MQPTRVCSDVFPRDLRPAAMFGLRLLDPLLPLTDASKRDERGEVAIAFRVPGEKCCRISVNDELRADDRPHRTLAGVARLVRVRGGIPTVVILERRHRLDAESRQAAQVGGVRDAEMRVAELTRVARECLGRDGAIRERKAGVGSELYVHIALVKALAFDTD